MVCVLAVLCRYPDESGGWVSLDAYTYADIVEDYQDREVLWSRLSGPGSDAFNVHVNLRDRTLVQWESSPDRSPSTMSIILRTFMPIFSRVLSRLNDVFYFGDEQHTIATYIHDAAVVCRGGFISSEFTFEPSSNFFCFINISGWRNLEFLPMLRVEYHDDDWCDWWARSTYIYMNKIVGTLSTSSFFHQDTYNNNRSS